MDEPRGADYDRSPDLERVLEAKEEVRWLIAAMSALSPGQLQAFLEPLWGEDRWAPYLTAVIQNLSAEERRAVLKMLEEWRQRATDPFRPLARGTLYTRRSEAKAIVGDYRVGSATAHLSETLFQCYRQNLLPTDRAGEQLRKMLKSHLAVCDACRKRGDTWSTLEVLDWNKMGQLIGTIARDQQQQTCEPRRSGGPRGVADQVDALAFDAAGHLLIEERTGEVKPQTVRFTVRTAEIDSRQGLFVSLLTTERPYCVPGQRVAKVQIALQHAVRRLYFAPVPLRPPLLVSPQPFGTATLRQTPKELGFTIDVPVLLLSPAALRVAVYRLAQGER